MRPVLRAATGPAPSALAHRIRWGGRLVDLVHDPRREDVVVFHGAPSPTVHDGMTQAGFALVASAGRDRMYVRDRVALAREALRRGRGVPAIGPRGVELP